MGAEISGPEQMRQAVADYRAVLASFSGGPS